MKHTIATALAGILLLVAPAFSQDANDVVSVAATGYGFDLDAAKKAAARAAVEQVVGQLVDAETLVENDELVKDRILTYSGAYLEDMDVVGVPTQADGLWTVKILAKVRKTQLQAKLETEKISKAKIKGGKLFAQASTKAQEVDDAEAMVAKAFENFPQRFVKAEMCANNDGAPKIDADANGEVTAFVNLSIDLDAYRAWAVEAMSILDRVADEWRDLNWQDGQTYQLHQNELDKRILYARQKNTQTIDFLAGTFPEFAKTGRLVFGGGALREMWNKDPYKELNSVLVCIAKPTRTGAVASAFRCYLFKIPSGKAKKIYEIMQPHSIKGVADPPSKPGLKDCVLRAELYASEDLLGARSTGLFEHSRRDNRSYSQIGSSTYTTINAIAFRPLKCYAGCFEFQVFPYIYCGNGCSHVAHSITMPISLGRYTPEILAEATDVKLSIAFE